MMDDTARIYQILSAHNERLNTLEKKTAYISVEPVFDSVPGSGYRWTYWWEPGGINTFADSDGCIYGNAKTIEFLHYVAQHLRTRTGIDPGTEAIQSRPFTIDSYITPSKFFRKYAYLFLETGL